MIVEEEKKIMKVELDLSAIQLKMLDESMTNLLENLSEEQKMTLISNYINYKFDKLTYEFQNSWGSKETKLSDFGNALIDCLQGKIVETVSEKTMQHENYKKIIEENIAEVIKKLPNILEEAISKHAAETLCNNKYEIESRIQTELWNMRREIESRQAGNVRDY